MVDLFVIDVDALLMAEGEIQTSALEEARSLADEHQVFLWSLDGQDLLRLESGRPPGEDPPWLAAGGSGTGDLDAPVDAIGQVIGIDPMRALFLTAAGSRMTELRQRGLQVAVVDPAAPASPASVPSVSHAADWAP